MQLTQWSSIGGGMRAADLLSPAALDGVTAVVSSRRGGASEAPFESLNMAFHVGDVDEAVEANRRKLFQALDVDPAVVVTCEQVHGSAVHVARSGDAGRGSLELASAIRETDALVTAERDLCLMVVVADCVPLVLFDPHRRVLAIAHCGWQGTAQGVADATLETMTGQLECRAADVIAALGPSICAQHYEVGPEVAATFRRGAWAAEASPLQQVGEERWLLDLRAANAMRLRALGVRQENVHMTGTCTFESPDDLYSHRRSGSPTGRVAACVMMR
ncbi:MAG: peptidoglycan editing factor PgeF [Anaerolineae bacterium]